jgi:transcriptional regulator with XRE-family HTH domain
MNQNETEFKNFGLCDIDKRIRNNILRLRSLRNLSQRQLGHLSGIAHIGQIESGHASAGKQVVCKLAKALHVDPSELYLPEDQFADTVGEIARTCAVLSKDGQGIILNLARDMAAYELRKKWGE